MRESAPAALDVRLLLPALAAWASASWAIGLPGERAWSRVLMAALVLIVLALPLGICTHRFRPPRHRYDPRPGAGALKGPAVGSVCASLLLSTAAAVAVLTVAAAGSWSRAADPLSRAVADGRTVTLIGTVKAEPRAVPGPGRTTVVTELAVTTVDKRASRLSALVLGGQEWFDMPMGATVRVRAVPGPGDPGEATAAVVGSGAAVRLVAPPAGALAVVGSLRAGLADAVQHPHAVPGRWRWPAGASELVSGVALGDDHALPADVRTDMRTVSMTHLTAVSGEHVAIVLGLVMSGLGVLPRRWRALVGALVLAALVVLVLIGSVAWWSLLRDEGHSTVVDRASSPAPDVVGPRNGLVSDSGVQDLTLTAADGQVRATWTYDGEAAGFLYAVVDPGAQKVVQETKEPAVTVPALPGRTCLEVVVRFADGSSSDPVTACTDTP